MHFFKNINRFNGIASMLATSLGRYENIKSQNLKSLINNVIPSTMYRMINKHITIKMEVSNVQNQKY